MMVSWTVCAEEKKRKEKKSNEQKRTQNDGAQPNRACAHIALIWSVKNKFLSFLFSFCERCSAHSDRLIFFSMMMMMIEWHCENEWLNVKSTTDDRREDLYWSSKVNIFRSIESSHYQWNTCPNLMKDMNLLHSYTHTHTSIKMIDDDLEEKMNVDEFLISIEDERSISIQRSIVLLLERKEFFALVFSPFSWVTKGKRSPTRTHTHTRWDDLLPVLA